MSIEARFQAHERTGRGALLPYLTAGFPDLNVTEALIRRFDQAGAACVEVGFPYSDSIADGPVIQSSFHYVLERGYRVEQTFELAARIRGDVSCALAAMVSFSIVHRLGVDAFMRRSAESGFDGVILPDLPVEEAHSTRAAVLDHGLDFVGLVAPTTSMGRRQTIARAATGFLYKIAAAGLTGERSRMAPALRDEVAELRRFTRLPICIGFGISTPQHVRQACSVADGAIVGSAVVRRIADGVERGLSKEMLVDTIAAFVEELASAAGARC